MENLKGKLKSDGAEALVALTLRGAAFLNPGIDVERKIYSGQREQSAPPRKMVSKFPTQSRA